MISNKTEGWEWDGGMWRLKIKIKKRTAKRPKSTTDGDMNLLRLLVERPLDILKLTVQKRRMKGWTRFPNDAVCECQNGSIPLTLR